MALHQKINVYISCTSTSYNINRKLLQYCIALWKYALNSIYHTSIRHWTCTLMDMYLKKIRLNSGGELLRGRRNPLTRPNKSVIVGPCETIFFILPVLLLWLINWPRLTSMPLSATDWAHVSFFYRGTYLYTIRWSLRIAVENLLKVIHKMVLKTSKTICKQVFSSWSLAPREDGRRGWKVERRTPTRQLEKNWTSLWRVQVPSKIRVFLWRLAKHSLLTAKSCHSLRTP